MEKNNDSEPTFEAKPKQAEVKLVDVEISDANVALNVLVSFISLAHKRGAFGLDESSKIWECIKLFQTQSQQGPK